MSLFDKQQFLYQHLTLIIALNITDFGSDLFHIHIFYNLCASVGSFAWPWKFHWQIEAICKSSQKCFWGHHQKKKNIQVTISWENPAKIPVHIYWSRLQSWGSELASSAILSLTGPTVQSYETDSSYWCWQADWWVHHWLMTAEEPAHFANINDRHVYAVGTCQIQEHCT